MIYDLINPYDQITFEAPDRQVAAAVCFLVSHGEFGADVCAPGKSKGDGANNVPIFLMGGGLAWWDRTFDTSFQETIRARAADIAAACESFLYGSPADRDRYEKEREAIAPTDHPAHRKTWQQVRQQSDNEICAVANDVAQQLRARDAPGAA